MNQGQVSAHDRTVLSRAAAILAEAGFPFSCLATVEIDHEAGRVLVISAANVDQNRVEVGFQLSDILARLQSDTPIACRAISTRATGQLLHACYWLYNTPSVKAQAVSNYRTISQDLSPEGSWASSTIIDARENLDAYWMATLRSTPIPPVRRSERTFSQFASSHLHAEVSPRLKRLVEIITTHEQASIYPPKTQHKRTGTPTALFESDVSASFQRWIDGVKANFRHLAPGIHFELDALSVDGIIWTPPTTLPPDCPIAPNTHYSLAA
jgi:hypothetical protein